MRYMASIYVSDVMDMVALSVELQQWSEMYGPPELCWQHTLSWPGVGSDDPVQWLRLALRAVLTDLAPPERVEGSGGAGIGGPHTISGSRDTGH